MVALPWSPSLTCNLWNNIKNLLWCCLFDFNQGNVMLWICPAVVCVGLHLKYFPFQPLLLFSSGSKPHKTGLPLSFHITSSFSAWKERGKIWTKREKGGTWPCYSCLGRGKYVIPKQYITRLVGHKVASRQGLLSAQSNHRGFCSGEALHQHWHTGLGGRGDLQFSLVWGFFVCLLLIAESRAFRIVFFIQLHF